MAILAMAMATLTPTATHRMHTHTLTVMGIAAFTPVMGITRAIDTEVTTLTAEPIIDTRATILIAGRGGRLTQRQLNDAERPPTPAVFPIARCAAAALESACFHLATLMKRNGPPSGEGRAARWFKRRYWRFGDGDGANSILITPMVA